MAPLKRLFDPASPRAALILSIITFFLVPLLAWRSGAARGGFRIDEAHKISESAFFPLWLHGDFRNSRWSADITDRTNPPVGKYLFGLAIMLTGQRVPGFPTLSIYAAGGVPENFYSGKGLVPPNFPSEISRPYEPFLPAARRVSIVCTALVAAIVAWCAARIGGPAAMIVTLGLFLTNFLTQTYGATAIFDPILTLFATALLAIAAAMATSTTRPRFMALIIAAGFVGALAFQTRINGLLFFAVTLLFIFPLQRPTADKVIGMVAAGGTFLGVALILNPYYWPNPIGRFRAQVSDLRVLLGRTGEHLTTPGAKFGYSMEELFGDVPGLLLLLFAIGGIAALVVRWRNLPARDRVIGTWSTISTIAFMMWMPLPIPRYLLVIVPPLCCLAALGCSGAVAVVRSARISA